MSRPSGAIVCYNREMELQDLNKDKYLSFFDHKPRLIVIYEHHQYDACDYDSISTAQIKHLLQKTAVFNSKQKSGRVIQLETPAVTLKIPKPAILGASSFDILRYEKQDPNTIFVLTPTQAACHFLTIENENHSLSFLQQLLLKHPINFKKIAAQIKTEFDHRDRFAKFRRELEDIQAQTVAQLREKNQGHLGRIF